MAAPWQPQLFIDRQRFVRNALNPNDHERMSTYKCVQDVLFGEVHRYGYLKYDDLIPRLCRLYDDLVERGMSTELRREVLEQVIHAVRNVPLVGTGAFLPFLYRDPDRAVVATATVEYVSLGPLINDDPMSRPKELINFISAGQPKNAGAIFGALLILGDPRLCKLLWPIKDRLSQEEANEAAQCTSGFVAAATIEFVLDWMEGLERTADEALFGSLASHLALQRRHMRLPLVMTGMRPFPVTSVSFEESRSMQRMIPFEDYVSHIAPRMIALAQAEPEPKVLPAVLKLWGIEAPSLNS